jgi:tungstate transport system substrate-binding protein
VKACLGRPFVALVLSAVFIATAMIPSCAQAQMQTITVASTTSTMQSGLFNHILPMLKKDTGVDARVVALGTGQALDVGRRGDADVVFVHDQPAEEKFVAEGFGVKRVQVMYNDFVLIGPKDDPARAGGSDIVRGFKAVYDAKHRFVSRGDKSGTHSAELRFWKQAGLKPTIEAARWYREVGSGMGPSLNIAAEMNAYILSDRGTWLAFKNQQDLKILVEGDTKLFNQYGAILVNPAKHPKVKAEAGQTLIDWLVSAKGQAAIASYAIRGEQLFFPNATK